MERLRTPFFIVAMVAAALVVLVELGQPFLFGGAITPVDLANQAGALGLDTPAGGGATPQPSGIGVPYLALVDFVAVFTVGLMGAGILLPDRLHAKVQGVVTLVVSIILITTALVLLFVALAKLILMVALLFAFPFGTIAYLIIWGSFPRGEMAVILSVLMFLKLVFAGTLVAAQQRFIQNKGLIALVFTSLVANVIVAFLHGMVPGILVSITDAVAGIVVAIIAIVWGIVLLIGSIPAIVNAVRASSRLAADAAAVAAESASR